MNFTHEFQTEKSENDPQYLAHLNRGEWLDAGCRWQPLAPVAHIAVVTLFRLSNVGQAIHLSSDRQKPQHNRLIFWHAISKLICDAACFLLVEISTSQNFKNNKIPLP